MDAVWLGDGADDTRRLGGKAAQLSRLASRYDVPIGFCLTTSVFQAAAAEQIHDALPDDVCDLVAKAYAGIGERLGEENPAVAVRSSAVDEDGQETSFAGQHDTFLHVRGADAVQRAVLRCWQSVRSSRALAYRTVHNIEDQHVPLAVLVQSMVQADMAAVSFSVDPIQARPDHVVINANWGLGESIVGGHATPDTYVVAKDSLAILDVRVGAKERMTVAAQDGTREVPTPRILRLRPVLEDARVRAIAELTITLEREMGMPVDVESAYAGDRLYLLQCRPVTRWAQRFETEDIHHG